MFVTEQGTSVLLETSRENIYLSSFIAVIAVLFGSQWPPNCEMGGVILLI